MKDLKDKIEERTNKINSWPKDRILDFQNTKHIDPELIAKIDETRTIRIIGGLDGNKKPKYDTESYFEKTCYNSSQIKEIIEKFQKIEKQINPYWNDLEKSMFVYKSLYDNMEYDSCEKQGFSQKSNLRGILGGKTNDCGFAIIYKEIMDRLNIDCLIMDNLSETKNQTYNHSWNMIKINGKDYPLDLGIEVLNKEMLGNECNFENFASNPVWFEAVHPQLLRKVDSSPSINYFAKEELAEAFNTIVTTNIEEVDLEPLDNAEDCVELRSFVLSDGNTCYIKKQDLESKKFGDYNIYAYEKYEIEENGKIVYKTSEIISDKDLLNISESELKKEIQKIVVDRKELLESQIPKEFEQGTAR